MGETECSDDIGGEAQGNDPGHAHTTGGRFSMNVPSTEDAWGTRTRVPHRHSTCDADVGSHGYGSNSGYSQDMDFGQGSSSGHDFN